MFSLAYKITFSCVTVVVIGFLFLFCFVLVWFFFFFFWGGGGGGSNIFSSVNIFKVIFKDRLFDFFQRT